MSVIKFCPMCGKKVTWRGDEPWCPQERHEQGRVVPYGSLLDKWDVYINRDDARLSQGDTEVPRQNCPNPKCKKPVVTMCPEGAIDYCYRCGSSLGRRWEKPTDDS